MNVTKGDIENRLSCSHSAFTRNETSKRACIFCGKVEVIVDGHWVMLNKCDVCYGVGMICAEDNTLQICEKCHGKGQIL